MPSRKGSGGSPRWQPSLAARVDCRIGRSIAEDASGADATECIASSKSSWKPTKRSDSGSSGWQQQQWGGGIWSQRMSGSRSFPKVDAKHGEGGRGFNDQCYGGAWNDLRSSRCFSDAPLRGAQNSAGRTQIAGSFCDFTGRRLGRSIYQSKSGDDGVHFKGPDFHRAMRSGFRQASSSLVADRILGAEHAGSDFPSLSPWIEAVQQTSKSFVDLGEPRLSSRPGLLRRSYESDWKTQAGEGATRRRSRAQEKAQEAKGSASRRRCGRRRCGRSRKLAVAEESPDNMHDQPSRISMGVCSALDESQSVIDNDVGGALNTPQFYELPDLNVERVFDPVQLGAIFCNSFLKCRTGLSQFIKLSLSDSLACNVQGSLKRPPIWPVPPPRWRWSASSGLGVKRRKQLRYRKTRHRLLQLIICSLNWEVLGHPTVPPRHAVLGASISS